MPMTKTQVYFRAEQLKELHRIARKTGRPVAELIREAVEKTFPVRSAKGPVALWDGPFAGCSADHDSAFDEP
jgi:hypothetical protein